MRHHHFVLDVVGVRLEHIEVVHIVLGERLKHYAVLHVVGVRVRHVMT